MHEANLLLFGFESKVYLVFSLVSFVCHFLIVLFVRCNLRSKPLCLSELYLFHHIMVDLWDLHTLFFEDEDHAFHFAFESGF